MKHLCKITVLFVFALLLAVTLSAVTSANSSNAQIFTAHDLINEINSGNLVLTNLSVSEVLDETGHHIRLTATKN